MTDMELQAFIHAVSDSGVDAVSIVQIAILYYILKHVKSLGDD